MLVSFVFFLFVCFYRYSLAGNCNAQYAVAMRMRTDDVPHASAVDASLGQEEAMKYLLLAADQGHELALYHAVCG
jgi:hypothetical protein